MVPGANEACDEAWLERTLPGLMDRDIFLFQLEIPRETVFTAVKKLHAAGKTVVLDPAPAVPVPDEVLACVDYITPNETELRIVTADLPENADAAERMAHLLAKGVKHVIAKTGAGGADVLSSEGAFHAVGFRVTPVDTTAAGDTFNAGLARALSEGLPLADCLAFANASAAISVTGAGAQGGMPNCEQVLNFLKERGYHELHLS